MRIEKPRFDEAATTQRLGQLKHFLAVPTDKEVRPCPGCAVPCRCSQSTQCVCMCSPECIFAPREMSTDPDDWPIETHIVPLVYALNSTRVCPPCWSCEGHADAEGTLHRKTSVWFYSESVVYPHLIADYLSDLQMDRAVSCRWQVSVVEWGHRVDTTYSIEPDPIDPAHAHFDSLWRDADTIATGRVAGMRSRALKFMQDSRHAQIGRA